MGKAQSDTIYTMDYIALSPAAMIYANERHVGVALILSSSFCPRELRGKTYFWFIAFPRSIEAAQLNDSRG